MRKQLIKKVILVLIVLPICSLNAQDDIPVRNTFYNPTINNSNNTTISPSPGNGNDTRRIQNQINNLSNSGGGTLTLANGTYRIIGLQMRSGVHIRCNRRVILRPFRPGNMISVAGTNAGNCTGCNAITNFSITSNDNRPFTVDMTNLDQLENCRFIALMHANNFLISNFNVIDNFTRFPVIEFLPGRARGMVNGRPNSSQTRQPRSAVASSGIVENITGSGFNPSWGIIQLQAGNTIFFNNLDGEGGITLRIESGLGEGLSTLNDANRRIVRINAIWGEDLVVRNGRCVLLASPHSHQHGFFNLRNLTAYNSEFGVHIARGFLTSSPFRPSEAGFEPGTFSNQSVIADLTVNANSDSNTTGNDNAQLRLQELRFIPCVIRNRIDPEPLPEIPRDATFITGPSVAPVFYPAGANGDGTYEVSLEGRMRFRGFGREVTRVITNTDLADFVGCTNVSNAIANLINVPRSEDRDNPRQTITRAQSAKLITDVKDAQQSQLKVYPNPASNFIEISNSEGSNFYMYNASGVLVKQILGLESTTINVSDLSAGIYFVRLNENDLIEKISIIN